MIRPSVCKPIQGGAVLQCMLFKTANPDAVFVGVEYFVAKELARKHVPLIEESH